MKKSEVILREILYQAIENKNKKLTQSELSKKLELSLSIVNKITKTLSEMGALEIRNRNFVILDIKKIILYLASIRNLKKDIIYSTRVELPVNEIEKSMPNNIVYGGYSAYKFLFKDVPADYSEVYVYAEDDVESIKDIEKRFPKKKDPHNLFILKKDKFMDSYGKTTTIANTFVDLWNTKEWYAKEFIKAMEGKLNGVLE